MKHAERHHSLFLRGKVVETYEQGGKSFVKIDVNSFSIKVEMEGIEEAHLGDKVAIEADISLRRAKKTLSDPV